MVQNCHVESDADKRCAGGAPRARPGRSSASASASAGAPHTAVGIRAQCHRLVAERSARAPPAWAAVRHRPRGMSLPAGGQAMSSWISGRIALAVRSIVASVIGSLNRRGPALPGLR